MQTSVRINITNQYFEANKRIDIRYYNLKIKKKRYTIYIKFLIKIIYLILCRKQKYLFHN